MKKGGGVDQERLITLLADFGQRGSILRLVGKFALLWGEIRSAMSLIGKLITFLRLSERPIFQRILGSVFMVLVSWTPVVVPLIPTLVQNLAEHNSSKIVVLVCIIGLCNSVMFMIMLWRKRFKGYEDPLKKYGLELTLTKQAQNFFYVTMLKLFGEGLRIVGLRLLTTDVVAVVEEMLFRSWLPEEFAADLGFNQGIILPGLAFSLCQWCAQGVRHLQKTCILIRLKGEHLISPELICKT